MKQLISQERIDKVASLYSEQINSTIKAEKNHTKVDFKLGVQFTLNEIQPLMVEFKEWCDENEHDIRLENIRTENPAITTKQLLEEFINSKNKESE